MAPNSAVPARGALTVGLIGLGAMGLGMAQSLRRKGYAPRVYDLRSEVAQRFAADGGVGCASPGEAAAGCDVLVSVVVNAAQTEAVLFGENGAAGALPKGAVFVMCSTADPNFSVGLEARLKEIGQRCLDTPISGGAARAARGEITMMRSAAGHGRDDDAAVIKIFPGIELPPKR